jgi:peptide chain release factor subunit 1
MPNISGIVLAGSACFKTELEKHESLDKRLRPLIISILDISYGGETGLNEAIALS